MLRINRIKYVFEIYKLMSLTLLFIVVSLAMGYLLYDTFKKSRQTPNKTSQLTNNKLKIKYTEQCVVLSELSKQKQQSIKTKTISIHLLGDNKEINEEDIIKIKQSLQKLLLTRRIYLLEKSNCMHDSLFRAIKQTIGPEFTIPYNTVEGAVAILRQLSCGLHLESQRELYYKIRQYVGRIWLVGEDPDQQAVRQFKTEMDMLNYLPVLLSQDEQKK